MKKTEIEKLFEKIDIGKILRDIYFEDYYRYAFWTLKLPEEKPKPLLLLDYKPDAAKIES